MTVPEHTYEVSRDELDRLRKQVNDVKKKPSYEIEHSQTLIESMDRLYDALSRMITLLENANREIYEDYNKGYHDEHAKLDRLLEQNEKLARGMVALADTMKQQARSEPATPLPVAAPVAQVNPSLPAFAPLPRLSQNIHPDEQPFFSQPVTVAVKPSGIPAQPILTPIIPQVQSSTPLVTTRSETSLPPIPAPPPSMNRRGILEKFSFK